MRSPWALAILAATVYVLVLNGGFLWATSNGLDSPAVLRFERGSPDQAHYAAYVRAIAQGHFRMGSSALREHRDDRGTVIYGPMLQGLLVRATGLSLETVLVLGSFLFPFLTFLILFAALRGSTDPLTSLPTTSIAMNVIGITWLRFVSPQVTFLAFALYLFAFLREDLGHRRMRILRGFLIGSLLFVQMQYALFALIIEGTDVLWRLFMRRTSFGDLFRDALPVALPFLVLLAIRVSLSLNADPALLADTTRRFGLIPSHLPAFPVLQMKVLGILLFFTWVHFLGKRIPIVSDRFFVLLLAALITLNQSVVHGFDAIFRLYYTFPITIILWFAFIIGLSVLLSRRKHLLIVGALSVLSITSFIWSVYRSAQVIPVEAAGYEEIAAQEIIDWLAAQPTPHVVAAPFVLADLIPALTDHTVLFNHYARFGLATDRELAERFLVYRRLFPESHPTIDDPTHGVVFSHYAGNLSARKRMLCRMLSWIRPGDCSISIQSQIYHQDVLQMIREDRVDEAAGMQTFDVSILIRSLRGRGSIPPACSFQKTIGPWAIYSCL